LALEVRKLLATENIKARVVSAPCLEWFFEQPTTYQLEVIPSSIKARVSIEAAVAQPWYRLIGDAGIAISIEHFGASASGSVLFKEFGFTPELVTKKVKETLKKIDSSKSQNNL
jgi:transketolase